MPFKQNSPGHIDLMRKALRAARERMARGEGYIYLADWADEDVVKIGFSLDPGERIKAVEYRGKAARLAAVIEGTHQQELSLHRQLRDHQIWENIKRSEIYPRSILRHPAVPAALVSAYEAA